MGEWHARAAEKSGGKIVCVADIDAKQAAFLALKYTAAESFSSAAEMLNQKQINVLHVCSPTATHPAIAEIAVKFGVNLFIEKPLAPTAEETIRLYDSASKNNVHICPVHQFAFQKGVEKAKKMLPRIGQIIHMQSNICSAGGFDGLDDEKLDSIASDILPHPLSLFQSVLNDLLPEEGWKVFRPHSGELRIYGNTQKISLSIFISMNSRPTVNSFQIIGTNGTIHLDLFHGFAFMETGKGSRARKILSPFNLASKLFTTAAFNLGQRIVQSEAAYPGLQKLVDSFYQSVRENKESPITSGQAINIARIRDYLISHAKIDI